MPESLHRTGVRLYRFGLYWGGIIASAMAHCADSKVLIHAAALAFFTLFSIAPVMIVAVAVAGLILGEAAAEGRLLNQLTEMIGPEAAEFVETAVLNIQFDAGGWLPTLIGVIAILIGATTVFAQMQQSLNVVWDVVRKPTRSGLYILLKNRLLSLTIVLSIGFILLMSLFLSVVLQAVLSFADQWIPLNATAVFWLELAVSLSVMTLLFATIFKVLPEVRLLWSDVWLGALITALLFFLGRFLMARYLTSLAIASAYGAAGSMVMFLLWVQYSSLVLLIGAAVARAQMEARGRPIRPKATAMAVRKELIDER
ncbi:MAG: YihY/virulence factor BrkB family protein [Natronospirillum sp.]|uniref:YihY/virulence factor BrkB family protein n=1 Tax=Natronospirillum sp. TaxID=2812955 RepID=UPI0025D72C3E|nr:YihY/virulence factor BrkB family protein [Natronospirillum sp.]MCH8552764.1 YihY/virulence factor BrkB family protein [Natronospirillum sp.]